jgi:hypothetical protein
MIAYGRRRQSCTMQAPGRCSTLGRASALPRSGRRAGSYGHAAAGARVGCRAGRSDLYLTGRMRAPHYELRRGRRNAQSARVPNKVAG